MIKFNPFPELSTGRLLLRQLRNEDDKEVLFLRSDERILKYIDIPKAGSLEDARSYIQKMNAGIKKDEWILWGITLKENELKIVGTICLWNISKKENKAEIGYVLHPDQQGRGIMQEAAGKVFDFGFNTMQLDIIDADLHQKNEKSIRLLKRNKFVFTRNFKDMVVYSLTKDVFNSAKV